MNWDFKLSGEQLQVLEWVDRFENSSLQGAPDIKDFADSIPENVRSEVLRELVKVDVENHWKLGDRKRVSHYFDTFPELQSSDHELLELYQAEFSIRERYGDSPSIAEYRDLLPDFQPLEVSVSHLSNAEANLNHPDPYKTILHVVDGSAQLPIVAEIDLGKYQIISKLGEGGFGIVYRCRDTQLNRTVAIKVPRRQEDGFTADMLHEAQTVAQFDHPNIVRLLGAEKTEGGQGFLVYEFVDGVSLADRIAVKDCTREQTIEWIAQIADALHYAHRKNVFHRDVKPGNILIDRQGNAILVDFGMARRDGSFYRRDDGVVLGTLNYMAPEQVRGDSDLANPETDLYSLGVVLYEALCGERPFQGGSFSEMQRQIEQRTPRSLRSVDDTIPASLEAVVEKALSKDPLNRWRTGRDIASELRRAVRPRHRYWWLAGAAAILFVAVGLAGWYFSAPPPMPEQRPSARIDAVTIHLARGDNRVRPLTDKDLPLRETDTIELNVILDAESLAYIYVFQWHPINGATLLWPPTSDEDVPTGLVKLKNVRVEPGNGANLFLAGVSTSPVSSERIRDLTSESWNASPQTLADLQSLFQTFDKPPTKWDVDIALRSDNDTSSNVDIRKQFEVNVGKTFDQYYGLIVAQQANLVDGAGE